MLFQKLILLFFQFSFFKCTGGSHIDVSQRVPRILKSLLAKEVAGSFNMHGGKCTVRKDAIQKKGFSQTATYNCILGMIMIISFNCEIINIDIFSFFSITNQFKPNQ